MIETFYDKARPWKTYLGLFQGDLWRLGLGLVIYLFKHSPVWVLPIYTAYVVDLIASSGFAWDKLLWPSLAMAALIIQNIFTHTAFARLLSVSLRNMEAKVRMAQVRRLQILSLHFHQHRSAGVLQSKILRDVENLNTLTNNLVNSVFPALITVTIAIILTLGKTPLLTLFFLSLAPLAILLQRLFFRRLDKNNRAYRKEIELMNSRVLEMIEMTPVTRAHGLEEVEVGKMEERFTEVQKHGKKFDLTVAVFGASAWVIFMTAQIASLLVMAFLAWKKMISVGDVLLFQSYFTMLVGSLNTLLNLLPDLAKGKDSIASIADILECPDLELNKGKPALASVDGGFRAENLSFSYPGTDKVVLKNLSFEVKPGETLAVVGESGSGKSTLMQLLIGFFRPGEGALFLDGKNMNAYDLRTYRRFLSTVPQQTVLFHGSVRENITYGLDDVGEKKVWEALDQAAASGFVRDLPQGIDTDLGVHGGTLSGGQKQRLAIARALLRNPRVVILDEATSALDLQSEREVQQAIERMSRGRTTFIVAHRMSTIRNAHRIMVLKDGQLAELGTHRELMDQRGEFYRLVRLGSEGLFSGEETQAQNR